MGQTQVLLIALIVIILGISIIVGIKIFEANAANANLDAVINDLLALSAQAQHYYLKPSAIGGGSLSFKNITILHLTNKSSNQNGSYSVDARQVNRVILRGEGKLDGDGDNKNCSVLLYVFADSIAVNILQR